MNRQCSGVKRGGGKCTATVEPPNEYCWWHDPANAEQRKRAAAKGGKSEPNPELAAIKARISDLADKVLAGSVGWGVAAVVSQVLNVYLRAVSVELKAKEQQDILERMEELERLLESKEERRGYGS